MPVLCIRRAKVSSWDFVAYVCFRPIFNPERLLHPLVTKSAGVCAAQAECDANRCVYRFPTLAWKDGQLRKKGAFGCEPLIRARPPEYWASTEALWFAAFESCTSTIALSAMPNAVRRMALAHHSRTETWDDSLGNESARSLLSRLPQNLKEEICPSPRSSRAYA